MSQNVGNELRTWDVAAKSRALLHRIRSVKPSYFLWQFLSAFAKMIKVTIDCVMSVHLSYRMEQICSHWTDFHEIIYSGILRKSVEKMQVSLKSGKNNGHFT